MEAMIAIGEACCSRQFSRFPWRGWDGKCRNPRNPCLRVVAGRPCQEPAKPGPFRKHLFLCSAEHLLAFDSYQQTMVAFGISPDFVQSRLIGAGKFSRPYVGSPKHGALHQLQGAKLYHCHSNSKANSALEGILGCGHREGHHAIIKVSIVLEP